MKKFILSAFLIILLYPAYSQKVNIQVVKSLGAVESEWRILDENYQDVFPGSDYFRNDTVLFPLEINTRYYFVVSFYKTASAQDLYTLFVDKEPVILVRTDIGPGDHFIPFFTGVRLPETKITGGTGTTISEFPWQVLVEAGNLLCGGSIIANNWILTAAHCTKKDDGTTFAPSQVKIRVGASNPFSPTQGSTYNASAVIPHENFDDNTLSNDIALIRLSTAITNSNASPVKIVNRSDESYGATDPGVMSWVTGWGLTNANDENSFPYTLMKVQLPIITTNQALTVWNSIPYSDLMAGFLNGNKDACSGDSGGPLVVPVMGEYKQAGIVSWGSSKCDTYGAYTRVSIFQDWIKSKTGITQGITLPSSVGDTIVCQGTSSSSYTVAATPGASNIQWRITPSEAGTVTGSASSATIQWNQAYSGTAILGYSATVSGVVTEWSRLRVHYVKSTRILSIQRDTAVCAREPVTLRVSAEGYDFIYRWYRDGVLVRTDRAPDLLISSAYPSDAGDYRVEIQGSCGTVTSGVVHLGVYSLTSINSVSPDANVPFGTDYTLTVSAGGTNLIYEWRRDTTLLQKTSSPSLLLNNVSAKDIGLYTVTVSGKCGTQTSDSIYVYVKGESYPAGPDVFLWPSVTRDIFNVAINTDQLYDLYIFNPIGQRIREYKNLQYQTEINVSLLPKGTYIVTVFNRNFRKSLKLIKN
jgi:secreted trypsin-like serine protease